MRVEERARHWRGKRWEGEGDRMVSVVARVEDMWRDQAW